MRAMSFALTKQQVLDRTKTVTRRTGWANLQPGTLLLAVKKAMGLKPGEQQERLCIIRVESVTTEPLSAIVTHYDHHEPAREGFPELDGFEFADMFCRNMRCEPTRMVQRIEFSYVPGGRLAARG